MKYKGCIFLISARKNILHECLINIDRNYNNQFNYPILIFYHGTKYDDVSFRKTIENINVKTKVSFHKIEGKTPEHLKEKDMFWNLNNDYAKGFTKERLGYLHAITWKINSIENEYLKCYDYYMMIDDDSWFKNKMDFDMFEELDKRNKLCGTAYTWNYVHDRVLNTRFLFYKWIKDYVNKYNVDIKNHNLKLFLEEGEKDTICGIKCNKNFHTMKYLSGNCNIYNRQMFETDEWKQYLNEFNKLAGGYRYRWGDCELISMFYYLHIGDEFADLDLINKNLYHNQMPNFGGMIKDKDM